MNKELTDEREQMINLQIKARGVKSEPVLAAMRKVRRELFVPKNEREKSYYDCPLSIGYSQTISQPYIVAYMTELLELTGNETVLELGTGSGYQTAILAELAKMVYTIEVLEPLFTRAKDLLITQLHYQNIVLKLGNGRCGWSEYAPFDRIILTAAPGEFPEELWPQLALNGMALAPVGNYFQQMVRYKKKRAGLVEENLISVSFVPLV